MFGWIFLGLIASVTTYVLLCGDNEQRQILFVLISAFLATLLFYKTGRNDWLQVEIWIVLADGIAFLMLTAIAFRSKRFWPLWIASFQLMPLLTFAATPLGTNLVSHALGVAQGLWGFFQIAILLAATIINQMREAKIKKSLLN